MSGRIFCALDKDSSLIHPVHFLGFSFYFPRFQLGTLLGPVQGCAARAKDAAVVGTGVLELAVNEFGLPEYGN